MGDLKGLGFDALIRFIEQYEEEEMEIQPVSEAVPENAPALPTMEVDNEEAHLAPFAELQHQTPGSLVEAVSLEEIEEIYSRNP